MVHPNVFRERTFTPKEESFHKERPKIPLENGITQDFTCHSKEKKTLEILSYGGKKGKKKKKKEP